jgi:diguanylate cyclase (GGDEF)-like protein/PAS domain S-box-containing protein
MDALAASYQLAVGIAGALGLACLALSILAIDRHFAFLKMRAAEHSFRDLYNNISEGVFRSTLDGRMISANPALVRLNGFDSEEEMLASVNDIAGQWYVDPNRRAELHRILVERGKVQNFVSEVYRYKTRERIWIEESTRLVRDKRTGQPLFYDGSVREVTETVRRLELQSRSDKVAAVVSGCLYQVRMRPDGSFSMPYVSSGITGLYEITPEEAMRYSPANAQLVHPDDRAALAESFLHSARTMTPRQSEYRIRTASGIEKWVFGRAVPEREADGSILWNGFLTDVTDRKRSEERIHNLAYYDQLTRLPNRAMLVSRLRQALFTDGAESTRGALLFIDLDQFKVLNDTKGHHIGDLLLSEVAARLRQTVRADDLVARLGGDEFVVVLEGLPLDLDGAVAAVQALGSRILSAIGLSFELDGYTFHTSASVGITLFHGDDAEVEDLLKRADLAMYEAKAAGRGSLRFFEPGMQEVADERLALMTELREALRMGGLQLAFQPQFDADGRCFAAEALIRWDNPKRGSVDPNAFVPLAERNGLSESLDEFVLNSACRALRSLADDPATASIGLAVNISAHQLNREGFVETVLRAVRESGADPRLLTLEITEHVMLDDIETVNDTMLRLKALGVRFALDDFGTGYSSLSYLKRLPIDTLKIDQSFIRDLESDPSDRVIVQTILNVARTLQLSVIAEGVETHIQALLLRQLGCHAYQGYLFARPMPLADFREAMARGVYSEVLDSNIRQLTA